MATNRVYNKPSAEEVAAIVSEAMKQPGVQEVMDVYNAIQPHMAVYNQYSQQQATHRSIVRAATSAQ